MNKPFGCKGCSCHYDDYSDEWRAMIDCKEHGELACKRHPGCQCHKCKGCTHPLDEPCFGRKETVVFPFAKEVAEDERIPSYDPPPTHYEGDNGLDPWAYIAAHGLDYWAGNVIKYVTRAGRKEIASVEDDLIKARNYLNYMIERERKGE